MKGAGLQVKALSDSLQNPESDNPPDLVIVDENALQNSTIDRTVFFDTIAAMAIPAICLSYRGDIQVPSSLVSSKQFCFLPKPISKRQLLEKIQHSILYCCQEN